MHLRVVGRRAGRREPVHRAEWQLAVCLMSIRLGCGPISGKREDDGSMANFGEDDRFRYQMLRDQQASV